LLDVAWAILKSEIPRQELFIIAKIAPWNYGYARTRQAFQRQLDELRLDYVDLLMLQWPHCWAPAQSEWGLTEWRRSAKWRNAQKKGSWRAFEEFYSQGKAKALGISNHTIDHFETLLQICNEQPHVWQCESHPHWSNRHIRNWCREKEVAFQGYAPFGGENDPEVGGRCALHCPVVTSVAEKVHKTPAQVCMFWNLTRNASVVVKSKAYRHLRENLHVPEEVRIPSSHLASIDQVAVHWKEYGPCYWGHNDVDNLHPWHNDLLIQGEMEKQSRSPLLDQRPAPLANTRRNMIVPGETYAWRRSQEPRAPPGAFAPGDEETDADASADKTHALVDKIARIHGFNA
jgi:diketogulonate reductase-like aldo/keto reductase